MGVVDFDPDKWASANSADAGPAKVAKPAKVGGETASLSQLSQLSQPAPLPDVLRNGLRRLRDMPTPRVERPDVWPVIVADALRLAADGWTSQALALGWEPLQLYGCRPGEDDDLQGLAVWIAKRPVVRQLFDERSCTVQDEPGRNSIFYRRPMEGAVFLWELNRNER